MKNFLVFFLLTCSFYLVKAQTALPKDAKIEGSIVDMRTKQPQNNELIIFRSQKNNNEYQAMSDSLGKFNTRLPVGDKYEIFIMGFKDSTSYNIIEIPAPRPNG